MPSESADLSKPFRLDGRVALVTGSSRGLGKEMAVHLARAGARVVMNYAHAQDTAEAAFADLKKVSRDCCLIQGDVTDPASVARICQETAERLAPIDILVLNATCDQPELSIEEYEWSFYQRMLDFFVKSPVLFTKACLPHMKQQGWGRIIHITSEVFALGNAPFSAYVAAKGGQIGFARSTARELAPFGITVNMIAPGWIPTERHADVPQHAKDNYIARVPADRWGTPADVAAAVVYYASIEAAYVTGQTLSVNGGNTTS
jgi:3-oxoacyl-[acyl-carrier protein] reductase